MGSVWLITIVLAVTGADRALDGPSTRLHGAGVPTGAWRRTA